MPIVGSIILSSQVYLFLDELSSLSVLGYSLLFLLVTFLMSFALSPTTFIAIAAGFLFGWKGMLFVVASYLIASLIGYLFFKKWSGEEVLSYAMSKAKFSEFVERMKQKEFLLVVFGRLSPVLPFSIMNAVFASLKINKWKFITGSFIGMFPRTILSVYIGVESSDLINAMESGMWNPTKLIVLLSLFVLSSFGIKKVVFG